MSCINTEPSYQALDEVTNCTAATLLFLVESSSFPQAPCMTILHYNQNIPGASQAYYRNRVERPSGKYRYVYLSWTKTTKLKQELAHTQEFGLLLWCFFSLIALLWDPRPPPSDTQEKTQYHIDGNIWFHYCLVL